MFSFRNYIFPLNREVRYSLQVMEGIGFWKSFFICAKIGLPFPFFFINLTLYLFFLMCFFFKRFLVVISHIQRRRKLWFEKWLECRYSRVWKFLDYLPVRGQRTRSNNGVRKRERLRLLQALLAKLQAEKQAAEEEKEAQKKKKKEAKKLAKASAKENNSN